MFDKGNFSRALQAIEVSVRDNIFDRLEAAYTQPHRYYHNQSHISECLRLFANHRHQANYPGEVEIALWFHDAIYDPRRSDNEERSAVWISDYLQTNGANTEAIARITDLILATKTHTHLNSIDRQLTIDIDLAILGYSREAFEAYDRAIRQEYAWVREPQYKQARSSVLQGFLQRPRIYSTEAFLDLYEHQARSNLRAKIAELNA